MFSDPTQLALALALGLSVGLVSSTLGLGGGVLLVPLLPLVFKFSHYDVLGTSLASIFCVVSINAWAFHRKGLVDWRIANFAGPASAVSAFGAGYFAQYIPAAYLKGFLATMLMLFAAKVIFGFKARKSTSSSERRWLFPLAGALAGAVSGLTGVGAGLILGPIMISLALTDNEKMSPTQNGVMVFTTFFAMLAYLRWPQEDAWTFGFVHFDIVLPVVIGASLSAALGRRWQSRVQADQRRLILGVMLLALSLKTMYAVLV